MAKVRFFARNDADGPLLVSVPGSRARQGQPPEYVGRKFVRADLDKGMGASHPATPEPFECDSESDVGQRLRQLTRRDGSLWPADKETADLCGVEFVPVTVKDGIPVSNAPKKKGDS